MTVSSHLCELESSGIRDCDAMNNPPPTGSGLEAGYKNPPAQAMLNWRTMLCCLTREKERQGLMTLSKEDQDMIHLEKEGQHIILRDEMKVMIAHNHNQCVNI